MFEWLFHVFVCFLCLGSGLSRFFLALRTSSDVSCSYSRPIVGVASFFLAVGGFLGQIEVLE